MNGVLKVCKGSMVFMKYNLESKLYILQNSIVLGEVVIPLRSSDQNQTKLWHLLLGHMSDKGLFILSKLNLLNEYKEEAIVFS